MKKALTKTMNNFRKVWIDGVSATGEDIPTKLTFTASPYIMRENSVDINGKVYNISVERQMHLDQVDPITHQSMGPAYKKEIVMDGAILAINGASTQRYPVFNISTDNYVIVGDEVYKASVIDPNDNIKTISKKVSDKVNSMRNKDSKKEGANDAIDTLGKLPNILRVPVVGLFKWMDKKGILPSGLVKDNLYYSSMIVSNLGSIKCGAIHHNITDFGHCSSLATMGEIKKEEIINSDGKKEIKDICEFGINFDERVADGYYFAKSVKMLQYLFDNPELLEEDASKEIDMKELR